MKRFELLAGVLTAIWCCLGSHLPYAATAAEAIQEGPVRVLLITGGHGFQQEPFFQVFDQDRGLKVTRAQFPEAAGMLVPESAERFDVLVFYDMWAQGISPEQQQGLLKLLDRGVGVVAMHHTLAAHQDWPEYLKIIGGKYHLRDRQVDGKTVPKSTFAHGQELDVRIADGQHPISRGIEPFQIHDETYAGYEVSPNVRVLLTTEHPKSGRELAWVSNYGNSRVFYLMLGHDNQAYQNPTYRKLIARGIRWSAGRPADPQSPTQDLLEGGDLAGWQAEGDASWEFENGMLVGKQGPRNAPGDLLTKAHFDDFELSVTFRVVWPANSGVWYRYQSAKQAYQADILEYKKPLALTGSLYCTGKMFLATNEDAKLMDREGWNTLVIRAAGNRHTVLLNGTRVADKRDDTSSRGRIGFQVHAGNQFAAMEIHVKEMTIRPL